jgi:hypothetical protein
MFSHSLREAVFFMARAGWLRQALKRGENGFEPGAGSRKSIENGNVNRSKAVLFFRLALFSVGFQDAGRKRPGAQSPRLSALMRAGNSGAAGNKPCRPEGVSGRVFALLIVL